MENRYLFTFIFAIFVLRGTLCAGDILLSVTQVFRHGERTPIDFYPTDPYKDRSFWDGLGTGQLTNRGKEQLLELGQYFRKRYGDFLSTKYSEDEIYVRTVSGARNHQSAESFLSGLYPDENTDIPLHETTAAVMGSLAECLRYDLLYLNLIANNDYFKKINEENSEVYDYVRDNSGSLLPGVVGVQRIWDTLYIESLQNYTLPEWTLSVFPEKLTYLSNVYASSLCYNEEMQKLGIGVFLGMLIEQFDSVLANPSKTQKVQLYSVHDVNIGCLLSALDAFNNPHNPDFGSSVLFELRQSSGSNFVNAYYKEGDEAVPISLKGCDFNCKLEDLKELLSNLLLTEPDWPKQCFTIL